MSLDLNDAAPQREPRYGYDLDELSDGLGDIAAQWVPDLFPRGRRVGNKWHLANIYGDAPRKNGSCHIELKGPKAGCWYDFGTGKGDGPLSTLGYGLGLPQGRELFA